MSIPDDPALIPGFPRTIHTKWHVLITSYGWTKRGQNVPWSRRQPAYGNGLIDRGARAYGKAMADACNANHVHAVSGYYEPTSVENPLPNFRSSFWAADIGPLKLCHMFSTEGFPGTRARIEAEVGRWANEMNDPRWARMRVGTSPAMRPILFFWGNKWKNDPVGFKNMIVALRNLITQRAGNPVIIATDHIVAAADHNQPGARDLLAQIDGAYTAACGLPWGTTPVGGDHSGHEWTAVESSQQLAGGAEYQRGVCRQYGKIFFSGTMPHFDRDLFVKTFNNDPNGANQGRVVATSFDQLKLQLTTARNFAPVVYSERRQEADGLHIYRDCWIVLTSLDEWEEGSTFAPNLVRGAKYTAPNWDSGDDALRAVREVFADTVVTQGG